MFTIRPPAPPPRYPDFLLKRGSHYPIISNDVEGIDGVFEACATVALILRPRVGGAAKRFVGDIVNHTEKTVAYHWAGADTVGLTGDYDIEWHITFSDATILKLPVDESRPYLWLRVLDDLS